MNGLQKLDTNNGIASRAQNGLRAADFDGFINYLDAAPKTVETYAKALRRLHAFFSHNGITRPDRADILAFRDELTASGYKPSTIQNYIVAARLFFAWAAQAGVYPNIAEHVKGAKLDRDYKRDFLTSGQVKALLASVDRDSLQGLRDYAMLTLMITGGLRTIEVSRANIEDLRALGDSRVLYIQGKGKEERAEYVKISEPVEKAMREYLRARGATDPKAPLFASLSNNSKGSRLTTRAISGMTKARLQAAGFNSDRLTAHSLRHTAVTLALLAGKELAEAQQFARHANIATTMIYNHAIEKAKNTCGDAITAAIF